MLALRYNNKFIELGTAQATIKIFNPIFDLERIARVYSFPFRIPLTASNNIALKFPSRIDDRNNREKKEADLFLANQVLPGNVSFRSADAKKIEIFYQSKALDFWEKLEGISLPLLLDTIDLSNISFAQPGWTFIPEDFSGVYQGTYGITYKEQTFFYVAALGNTDTIFIVSNALADKINIAFPNTASVNNDGFLFLKAEDGDPFLAKSPQQLTEESRTTYAQSYHDRFINYVNSLRNTPDSRFCFPTVYAPKFYDTLNTNFAYRNRINPVEEGIYQGNVFEDEKEWRSTYVPYVFIAHLLEKIALEAGLEGVTGSFTQLPEYHELIYYNNRTLDEISVVDNGETEAEDYLNSFQQKWNLNKLISDDSAKDFLFKIIEKFNVWINISDNKLLLNVADLVASNTVVDLNRKIVKGYRKNWPSKKGITFKDSPDPEETYEDNQQLQPYIYGLGNNSYETAIGTLYMVERNLGEALALLPTTETKCYSDALQLKFEVGEKILLYKGWKEDSLGYLYPFATHGTIDYSGNQVGTLSLDWSSPTGLFRQLHRKTTPARFAPTISIDVVPNNDLLFYIDKIEQWSIRADTPDGLLSGVIGQIVIKNTAASINKITLKVHLI